MKPIIESSYLILGMGNIGKIMIQRLLDVGVPNEQILINDVDGPRLAGVAAQYGVKGIELSDPKIKNADVVILATPPKAVIEVLSLLGKTLHAKQLVISMAAAVPIDYMRSVLPETIPVARILPNPPSLLGKGMNPVAFEPGTKQVVKDFVFALLEVMGSTIEVQDSLMTWCVGLSGAALRTILPVLEGMTLAGVEAGLSQNEARRVAALNMAGVAALALETDLSFEQIHELTPMQTLDEKVVSNLFLETARSTQQKVETTQKKLMEN